MTGCGLGGSTFGCTLGNGGAGLDCAGAGADGFGVGAGLGLTTGATTGLGGSGDSSWFVMVSICISIGGVFLGGSMVNICIVAKPTPDKPCTTNATATAKAVYFAEFSPI